MRFQYCPTGLVLSGEADAAQWVPVEPAIHMVHPNGSVSYVLLEKYMKERRLCQTEASMDLR